MSPALCGTMQCLSTAYVSHSSSNNDSSSSKSSDSRSDASAEVTKAVVTVTAIGSNTNWQYVQQHATGGAGLQPSFGNGEGIINRQSADDVCLFDLLACDASLICLAHFCMWGVDMHILHCMYSQCSLHWMLLDITHAALLFRLSFASWARCGWHGCAMRVRTAMHICMPAWLLAVGPCHLCPEHFGVAPNVGGFPFVMYTSGTPATADNQENMPQRAGHEPVCHVPEFLD